MSKLHNFLTRFQLHYRRTPVLTKAVMGAAIVLSTVTLVTLTYSRIDAQQQLALLQEQAAVLEEENLELRERIDDLGTADSIREIAREELGMVDADTVIIDED